MGGRVRILLAASLLLNLVGVVLGAWYAHRKGYDSYAVSLVGTAGAAKPKPWEGGTVSDFRRLPGSGGVFFAGDSITRGVPWSEYFSDIHNRGIGGDTSEGLLARLDEIAGRRPAQLFVNIGTNDLYKQVPPERIAGNVRAMIRQVREASPHTQVIVVSVLPVEPSLMLPRTPGLEYKLAQLGTLNDALRTVAEAEGARFADVRSALSDAAGNLRREYTADGTHLSFDGQGAYAAALRPYVTR